MGSESGAARGLQSVRGFLTFASLRSALEARDNNILVVRCKNPTQQNEMDLNHHGNS